MKKIILFSLLCSSLLANAQYKKAASFFTRNGKFYGFKTGLNFYSKGTSITPVLTFVSGRDKGKNRIWHWWDWEYTFGSKYHFNTVDAGNNAVKVNVSGKIGGMFIGRYNWAFYFADNKNEDLTGLPFAKIGIEFALAGRAGGSETVTPSNAAPLVTTYRTGANAGIDLGGGYTYKLNENVSLFGVAGYRLMLNEAELGQEYFTTPSHPYLHFGIKLAKKSNDD